MSSKKSNKRKNNNIQSFQFFLKKNLDLSRIKIKPVDIIENTKNKIENFYDNFKKER